MATRLARRMLLAVLLLASAGMVLARLLDEPDAPSSQRSPATPRASSSTAASAPGASPALARDLVAEDTRAVHEPVLPGQAASPAARPELRVRLRGLRADAPWTAAVLLRCEGPNEIGEPLLVHTAQVEPTAGLATFVLPAWVTTSRAMGQLAASDPNYLPVLQRWQGALDLTQELVLDVQAAAKVEGRVVDQRGEPVEDAQVAAFVLRAGMPAGETIRVTLTDAAGRYTLAVPPATQLCLVAAAVQCVTRIDDLMPHRIAHSMRAGLLPARRDVVADLGAATRLDDLVLADAAKLTGTVRWGDGRAVAAATLWVMPPGGELLQIGSECSVHVPTNGSLLPRTSTRTAADGTFELPAVPGAAGEVALTELGDAELVGDWPTRQVAAPQHIEFVAPLPLRLRTVRNGAPLARTRIEIEGLPAVTSDDRGEARLVATLPSLRVRAIAGAEQSPWIDVLASAALPIELELAAAAGELTIEFEGERFVRAISVVCTRADGSGDRLSLAREPASGPFRLHLEPGHYRLRIAGAGGRDGLCLLPVERDVDVTVVPQAITLPANFGGRFAVHATDGSGLYVAGTCRVLDAGGGDRTARFVVHQPDHSVTVGEAGEVMAGNANEFAENLPAGEYLLEFDFPSHGTQQQRVTIRPNEVADVRIRLP